jgi:hypothetical protein
MALRTLMQEVEKLVTEILGHESDTFSSSNKRMQKHEAELIAAVVISSAFDKYDGYLMENMLTDVRENLAEG